MADCKVPKIADLFDLEHTIAAELFEGKEYPEVDLSNLDNLTARDLMAIGRQVGRVQGGTVVAPELNPEYTVAIAARVASLPLEFFYGLPAREFVKVRGAVTGFLFASGVRPRTLGRCGGRPWSFRCRRTRGSTSTLMRRSLSL